MAIDTRRISAEQLRLLFAALPLTLAGSTLNALILSAILWPVVNHPSLLIWLGLFLSVNLLRAILLYRYRQRTVDRTERDLKWFLISTLLSGLAWGCVSLFLFPHESVPHQSFIAFVMAGNSAAAIISLSYVRRIALAFILPSLLPLIIQFLLLQTNMSIAMGAMISLFLFVALSGIRRNHENILQNIILRFESIEHEKTILTSQQKLALHVQQTPLAVIEWSTGFKVSNWNPAAERIFGYKKSEAMGRHAADIIVPATARAAVDEVWHSLLERKGGLHSTNENITKDGRTITCEWFNTPLINEQNEVVGIASLAQDISERVKIESVQSDFISTVSHELRTPLTSIRGAIGLLSNGVLEPNTEEYKHVLEIADNNSERLLLIINDILDIQKIESGKMEFNFQPVALRPFLEDALEANQAYAEQYQVKYHLDNGPQNPIVRADPNRLMQVMNNLLSNAAKFSRPRQEVEIGLLVHDGMAQISVQDHGAGIAEDFVDHIFERFTQGDSSNTRQSGGTGLGLSIVKNIVEYHQGTVSFESKPGRGTRFFVDLPLI